jgi:hypothetical protein
MIHMPVLSLHPNQVQIVSALQSARRILDLTADQLTIVGSLGKFLAGAVQRVGDIDVLIDAELCKRYWEFLEILSLNGLSAVYDVLDRPRFPWNHCYPTIAHPRALTVDCRAHALGLKHSNLDIFFKPSDLSNIRHSCRWVYRLNPDHLRNLDEAARMITEDHQKFVNDLKETPEQDLASRRFHDELGLSYVP